MALSSGEAEFYAAGKAAAHALFFFYLLAEVGRHLKVRCRMDSSAARGIFGRQGPGRIRHLAIRYLWVQEKVRDKLLAVDSVPGTENEADIATKILSGDRVRMLASLRPRARPRTG